MAPSDPKGSDGLTGVYALLQQTLTETMRQAGTLAELRSELHGLTQDTAALSRILRGDGNGEKGVATRVLIMEGKLDSLAAKVDSVDKRLENRGLATETGRWSLMQAIIVAVVTGLFLLAAAVVGGFIKMGGGR